MTNGEGLSFVLGESLTFRIIVTIKQGRWTWYGQRLQTLATVT